MTASTPNTQHEDSEYEYQYDDHETESLLIDLDLSSVNGTIKSRHRKNAPRRRGAKKAFSKKSTNPDASNDEESADDASPGHAETQAVTGEPLTLNEKDHQREENLQILDIASGNPIISYQGQLYSGSWTDMIGTTMFFSRPSDNQGGPSLHSNSDFDLIGTSRVKLVGQKAKLVSKSQSRKRERSADGEEDAAKGVAGGPEDATSFPGFSSTNWRTNIERRKQANFLDRLMQAKRVRGDNDIVTTLSDRTTDRIYRSENTNLGVEEKLRIKNLSDRVVKGDARAVTSLREIYSQLDTGSSKPDPTLEDAIDIPTPNSATNDQQLSDHG